MRSTLCAAVLLGVLVPALAVAGYNQVYLVPAVAACAGPASCPRQLASPYTFDSILVRTPGGRWLQTGKPTLIVSAKGIREASGAPFTGTLTLRVLSGRVSVGSIGTLPDDSPLAAVAPVPVPVSGGRVKRLVYSQPVPAPNDTIVNGGGIEVYDPEGRLLATTGSQTKP